MLEDEAMMSGGEKDERETTDGEAPDGAGPAVAPAPVPRASEAPAPQEPLDPEEVLADCDLEFVRAGGPGGQHRNRRETGVRLTHRPTGVVAGATERRSQVQNRALALERMVEKLEARRRKPRPRKRTRKGSGVRRREREARQREAKRKQARRPPRGDDD